MPVRSTAINSNSLTDIDTTFGVDIPINATFTAELAVDVVRGAAAERQIVPRPLRLKSEPRRDLEERIALHAVVHAEHVVIAVESELQGGIESKCPQRQTLRRIFGNERR